MAVFIADGTDVVGGLSNLSLWFLSRLPLVYCLGSESPFLYTMTPGVAVCHKDLPGVAIDFSESHVTLESILGAKKQWASASDALLKFPVLVLP